MPATPRPCETRDPAWWETGDDGNRLALMLCDVCPGCPDNDPRPNGVIRSGKAYGEDWKVRARCPCGYPAEAPLPESTRPGRPARVQLCRRCQLPGMEPYREAIIRWHSQGIPYTVIAKRIAFSADHISKKHREWTADREATTA